MFLEKNVKDILEDNLRLFPWRVKMDETAALMDIRILKAIKDGDNLYIDKNYCQMVEKLENLINQNIALALVSNCDYTRTFAGSLILLNKSNQTRENF